MAARSLSVLGGLAKGQRPPTFWSYRRDININFKCGYLASYVLGSWPKASHPCVMVLPANCWEILTLFKIWLWGWLYFFV